MSILLADVMNRANVGMVQRRSSLRLALKAGQRLRVSGDFIGQELEGNKSVQPRVLGLVHHAHSATAELLDDAVMRYGLADQTGNSSPSREQS